MNFSKELIKKDTKFSSLTKHDLDDISEMIMSIRTEDLNTYNIRSITKDYYNWIYFENPAGEAIVYKGVFNNKIVCSFAIAPKKMLVNNQEIIVGKTMDMFTRNEFQGKGLMKLTTDIVFKEARKKGILAWYVNPSVNSYPIFKNKWGYQEILKLIYRMRILKTYPFLKTKFGFLGLITGRMIDVLLSLSFCKKKLPPEFNIKEENFFGKETDELWQKCQKREIMLIRDSRYMTWRYIENPDDYIIWKFYKYKELQGIIILKHTIRKAQKVGDIVDYMYLAEKPEILKLMLKQSIIYFMKHNTVFIQSWVIQDSEFDHIHKNAGLRWNRKEFKFLLSPDFDNKMFYNENAWYFTQGDGNDV